MSYLGKAKKQDLALLAEELGQKVTVDMKVIDLKNLILASQGYDEEFVKTQLEVIIEERRNKENLDNENKKREKEELRLKEERDVEARKVKEQLEMETLKIKEKELELEKMRLEIDKSDKMNSKQGNSKSFDCKWTKVMPKFDPKDGDIVLFLTLFERQSARFGIEKANWVSALLTLLPSDITEIIARESDDKFDDYDYIKGILLRKFKLSAENFRQKFVKHQRNPAKSWRDFTFEITSYFKEWIDGLEIIDFEGLKNLMITDQLKKRVPAEIREHFVDDWCKFIMPSTLADKLDEYESIRASAKKTNRDDLKLDRFHSSTVYKGDYFKNKGFNQPLRKPKPNIITKDEQNKHNFKPTCFTCGAVGHISKFCDNKNAKNFTVKAQNNLVKTKKFEKEISSDILTAKVTAPVCTPIEGSDNVDKLKFVKVKCGKAVLKAVIDTGAQISVVREDLLNGEIGQGDGTIQIMSAFGECEIVDLKVFSLKIDDGVHGEVPITCAVSKKLVNDMLICSTAYEALLENVQLSCCPDEVISKLSDNCDQEICREKYDLSQNSETKLEASQPQTKIVNNVAEKGNGENSDKEVFVQMQSEDEDLKKAWTCAENGKGSFKISNGVLIHSDYICGENIEQVVLPSCKRKEVLRMAHEIPLAGHLGEQKTRQRIKYSFYWPSIKEDVKKYCESCKVCQLRKTASYRDRVPIQPIVRPENPFEVWSVDCIGPLEPPSRRGHKYVICAVDLCTRWAEAVPVTNISAKTTCNTLMKIFTQTGFPKMLCTDQGTNFTAKLTEAFLEVIGISPRFSTPGHPESMGAVERWNRTLKDMLNKNIQEHGSEWDLHLPYLLFAYREVPHSTTGMSPFQLVYGRLPSGPLSLLKDVWIGERKIPTTASSSVEKYLSDVVEKLRRAHEIASENASDAQERYASRYNLRARDKHFKVGEKVLILIPSSSHKLLNTWIGPATIVEITRPYSAIVELEDGSRRELHFNKLRPYIARVEHIGLIFEEDKDFGDIHYAPTKECCLTPSEIIQYINKLNLDHQKQNDLKRVICKYHNVFSTKPRIAKVEGHSVRVTSDCSPKKLHPYRVPIVLQKEVEKQIQELLDLQLIEHSDSEWAHPVVCVAKKDGSVRLCVDFRLLNSYTIPDAYPMKNANELIYLIGNSKFITVLDLTKGYWQIPMKGECKQYTAFVTHSGHYQWNVMPFGMKNAGNTFQKSIDKTLERHKEYCRSYVDDVAIFSQTWSEHITHLQDVLKTFEEVNLTVNLMKCDFGKSEVKFLGHIIGSGRHTPDPEKTEAIRKMARPETKRELRGLLGLANYYRDYIPNFASIVLPLTDLTKKRVPNIIPWSNAQEEAFQNLKQQLMTMPSLYTPIIGKVFQLYTDASSKAVGACLSQYDDLGKEHPIAFYSKKLSSCQMRWSTIEREAYSVLTALHRFDSWIFGSEIEVISDHNPLTYLTKTMPQSAKLARWALALQRYNLKISYRKGKNHGNADALSRLP